MKQYRWGQVENPAALFKRLIRGPPPLHCARTSDNVESISVLVVSSWGVTFGEIPLRGEFPP